MGRRIYDWQASRSLSDFRLEGRGELQLGDDGALLIRTYDCGPLKRATTVWLKNVVLPKAFQVDWTFRSNSAAGNSMSIFNALPLGLKNIFEDPRPDALYCDIASFRKMIAHSVGFHRSVYGKPSVLRKLGGRVPEHWGMMIWPDPPEFEKESTMSNATEPLAPADKGKRHNFRLIRRENTIDFFVNGRQVHAWTENGQYPYWKEPLSGGHMAFRNFTGFADDFYQSIVIEEL
ncbi:MAG TPA: hypothetical protein VEJ63_13840 [Planctomycetota bacterium]|nr:hypothetical protein [Planctomycetota bacterium]